jgi:hypothetical protein
MTNNSLRVVRVPLIASFLLSFIANIGFEIATPCDGRNNYRGKFIRSFPGGEIRRG